MDITIDSVAVQADDIAAAQAFYTALGLTDTIRVVPTEGASTGFRGYTLSLVVAGPSNVDAYLAAARAAGATILKPAKKSLWGYGAAIQAPDGAVWTFASSSKKDDGHGGPVYDDLVLLLGVEDVKASKRFYAERGFVVAKSFGGKYAEFEDSGAVKLALNPRGLAAKNAGIDAAGSGSHRLAIHASAGAFTDPDGFAWE